MPAAMFFKEEEKEEKRRRRRNRRTTTTTRKEEEDRGDGTQKPDELLKASALSPKSRLLDLAL